MSLARSGPALLLFVVFGAHGCARPLPRSANTADPVRAAAHVPRERSRAVKARGFVERFDGGFVLGLWVHNDTYAPVVVSRDSGLHRLEVQDAHGEAHAGADPGSWEPAPGRRAHTSLDEQLDSLDGVLLTPGDEVRLVAWLDDDPIYASLLATFVLRILSPGMPLVEELRLVSLDAAFAELPQLPAPTLAAGQLGEAPVMDDGRVYELGAWGYAVGLGVTNRASAAAIVAADWFVASFGFPDGLSSFTGRRGGWSCTLHPRVVPSVCHWLSGILLAPGETVTLFSHQDFEPQGAVCGVSVGYEINVPTLPCEADAWLRGDYLADTQPLR